jgi:hypothetical protein
MQRTTHASKASNISRLPTAAQASWSRDCGQCAARAVAQNEGGEKRAGISTYVDLFGWSTHGEQRHAHDETVATQCGREQT